MSLVLEAAGVIKTYGSGAKQVQALRGLSLNVPKGLVYGLLGPNGAGKSTLLRIVLGLVRPSGVQCALLGEAKPTAATRRRVGAIIESPTHYPFLTARQSLEVFARTSGFREKGRINEVLERVDLTHAANRRVKSFSLGMKQRLGVAAALLTRPELIILDEPMNGLDPAGIQDMRELMRALVKEGSSIILSSHLMEEVQKTCDRVAIMNLGQLVAEGNVAELLAARGAMFLRASPVEKALAVLGPNARASDGAILVDAPRDTAPALIRDLVAAGIDVYEARWQEPSLEAVFLQLTGAA